MSLENPQKVTDGSNKFIISDEVKEYFTLSQSKAMLVLKKFIAYLEKKNEIINLLDTEENKENIYELLKANRATKRLMQDVSFEEIAKELTNSGMLKPLPVEKKVKTPAPEPEFIKTEIPDEMQIKLTKAETNISDDALEKNILTSEKKILLSKERIEKLAKHFENKETQTWEYYKEFVDADMASEEEAKRDFEKIQEIKEKFDNKEGLSEKEIERLAFAKNLATITEVGIAYLINEVEIFGEQVKMNRTAEFSDFFRGVDSIIEIEKDDGDRDFIGIATDITFRRLEDISFVDKVYSLLKQIKNPKKYGYKSRVKFEKDSKGNLLKEFAVPKTILQLNLDDVRLCTDVLNKSLEMEKLQVQKEFQNFERKKQYLNQTAFQCKIFSEYAQKNKHPIFRKYDTGLNAIIELSWKNKEIEEILKEGVDEKFEKKMKEIIKEFDSNPKNWE